MNHPVTRVIAAILMALPLGACTGSDPTGEREQDPPAPGACQPERQVGGACAGAPSAPLCAEDFCTVGVECSSTVEVGSAADLAAALSGATSGTCLALAPGAYGIVTLPAGTRLLGKGADFVEVEGVIMNEDTILKGVKVTSGGVKVLAGATAVRIEATRIAGSAGIGLELEASSSVEVLTTEVVDSGLEGVFAESAYLWMDNSAVLASGGPGIWSQCQMGCGCPATLALAAVLVEGSNDLGVAMIGVKTTVDTVDVKDTHPGSGGLPGGVAATTCADLTAARLRVLDTDPFDKSYGLLVDGSSATLGGPTDADGLTIEGNFVGMWVQNLDESKGQTVTLEHSTLTKNRGVALGLSGQTKGLVIDWTVIRETSLETMPTYDGQVDVGDGIVWQDGAQGSFADVTLAANARASILIDGEVEAGSSLANVTLADGDQAKGILQQNFPANGQAPTVSGSTPAVTQVEAQQYSVPTEPATPAMK